MKRRGFWREAGVALALSIIGAVAYHALATVSATSVALRLVIAGLGILYAVLLLRGMRAHAGRLVAIAGWLALDVALFAFDSPLLLWLLAQVFAIWLLRCWCCYASLFAALADAALGLFALAAALVAAAYSHSVFLALWSFWLVQALFVLIPDALRPHVHAAPADDEDRFSQAQRTAEAALRRLATRH